MLSRGSDVFELQRRNAHARDAHIVFHEEGHEYFVDGKKVGTSVTGVLHAVETEPFDADAAVEKILSAAARGRVNPKYADMTAEQIKASWDAASVLGTDLHGKIERHLNGLEVDLSSGVNAREFAMAVKWIDAQAALGYEPYRTEWVIYSDDADVAGSIDCVLRNKRTNGLLIVDWKRCDISGRNFESAFRDARLRAPMAHLPETKRTHWMLQVNLYRHILETHYGVSIEGMMMVVCTEASEEAVEVRHDRMDVCELLNLFPRTKPTV